MIAIGRIFRGAGRLLFDPVFTETATKTLKASRKAQGWKNVHTQLQDCFVKAGQESVKQNPSLWKAMKKSLTSLPKDMKGAWKNTSGAWGKTKAIGKQFFNRMPLIGGIMMVGFELPNIISAFKDKGLIGGVTETVKSGSRLLGSMAGFAIGQALIPIPVIGGLIGAIGGDWLISKITGKSHKEKKAETEEALAQAGNTEQQAQQLQQYLAQQEMASNPYAQKNAYQQTMTPQQLMAMRQMLYSGMTANPMDQDFMAMTSGINRMNYIC